MDVIDLELQTGGKCRVPAKFLTQLTSFEGKVRGLQQLARDADEPIRSARRLGQH